MPPPPKTDTDPDTDTPDSVSVRMYRGLLGDCFLLTQRRGGETFRALIDCGVLQCIGASKPRTKAALAHMAEVVKDLKKTTGGVLDLVIATHEHYDHLSGFLLHFDVLKTFEIRAVWMAWTEHPLDHLATDIRARGKEALSALRAAVDHPVAVALAARDDDADDRRQSILNLLQFYGEIEPWTPPDALAAAPRKQPGDEGFKPRSCQDVLQWLKFRAPAGKVRYLEPGQTVAFGLGDSLTAKVLGPPRRADRLLKLDPVKGENSEVYLVPRDDIVALTTTLRFLPAKVRAEPVQGADATRLQPFSARFHRTPKAAGDDTLARLYFGKALKAGGPVDARTVKQAEARRIDGEWLGTAEQLALKIDGDVNNTSLALAIETPGSERRVMLFAADAQVGNWLSWHDQSYPLKPPAPGAAVSSSATETATQILGRVAFYKVGHHGSHNATAREKGLELMTSPHLTAMIPVVEEVAREQKSKHNAEGWAMPFEKLDARLQHLTQHRVLRGDGSPAAEQAAFKAAGSIFDLSYAGDIDPLWVELTLDQDA